MAERTVRMINDILEPGFLFKCTSCQTQFFAPCHTWHFLSLHVPEVKKNVHGCGIFYKEEVEKLDLQEPNDFIAAVSWLPQLCGLVMMFFQVWYLYQEITLIHSSIGGFKIYYGQMVPKVFNC